MPGRSPQVPAYRLHKPTGQAVVRLDGRDKYLGKHGTPESRAKYDKTVAEWLLNRQAPPPQRRVHDGPPSLSITELLLAYLRFAHQHYRDPAGQATGEFVNIKAALRPVRQLYGLTQAGDFGPLALRAVQAHMAGQEGLARTTINARVNKIRRVFRWAASLEMIPVEVVQRLATVPPLHRGRTTARDPEAVGSVSMAVVEQTLPHLSRTLAAMVRLQLLTGMRPGEVCKLRGIDLVAEGDGLTYRPPHHKTAWRGKVRTIPLGPKARAIIAEFARPDPQTALFDPRESVAEYHALRSARRKSKPTPSERARRAAQPGAGHARCYNRNTYGNAIDRACRRAFPHPTLAMVRPRRRTAEQQAELRAWDKAHAWHPNQLRHTAATRIRASHGLEAAQAVLGHSDGQTTLIYAERDLAKARAVIEQVG